MPYHTTGSDSLAAIAIMYTCYQDNMTKEEAINLCAAAIEVGIYHYLGQGSNVDVCIVMRGRVEFLRNLKHDNFKVYSKLGGYHLYQFEILL